MDHTAHQDNVLQDTREVSSSCRVDTFGSGDNVPMWWKTQFVYKSTVTELTREKKRSEHRKALAIRQKAIIDSEYSKYSQHLNGEKDKLAQELKLIQDTLTALKEESASRLASQQTQADLEIVKAESEAFTQKREAEIRQATESAEAQRIIVEKAEERLKEKIAQATAEKLEAIKRAEEANEKYLLEKSKTEKVLAEKKAVLGILTQKKAEIAEKKKQERLAEKRLKAEAEEVERQRIEAENIRQIEEERIRVQAEEEERIRLKQLAEEERLKREEEERINAEMRESIERKRIARLRRKYRIRDVEFNPYLPDPSTIDKDAIILFNNVTLVDKVLGEIMDNINFEIKPGTISKLVGLNRREINTIVSILMRSYPSNQMLRGNGVYCNGTSLTAMSRKEHHTIVSSQIHLMSYDMIYGDDGIFSVGTYLKSNCGGAKMEKARDMLIRLNVSYINRLFAKKLRACTYSEMAKVCIVASLLSDKPVIVMCEPQRCLDMIGRQVLSEMLEEWRSTHTDKTLILFDSDKDLVEGDIVYEK